MCSLATSSRGPATPACCSSRPVRRVSSQTMASAPARAATARGERSARLPIGVATSTRRPVTVATRSGHGAAHRPRHGRRTSNLSPTWRPQRPKAPASASITCRAPNTGMPTRCGAMRTVFITTAGVVEVGDVEGEAHPDRVHPAAPLQEQGALDAVAAEQARPPLATGPRHLDGGQHPPVAEQPALGRHGRAASHAERAGFRPCIRLRREQAMSHREVAPTATIRDSFER